VSFGVAGVQAGTADGFPKGTCLPLAGNSSRTCVCSSPRQPQGFGHQCHWLEPTDDTPSLASVLQQPPLSTFQSQQPDCILTWHPPQQRAITCKWQLQSLFADQPVHHTIHSTVAQHACKQRRQQAPGQSGSRRTAASVFSQPAQFTGSRTFLAWHIWAEPRCARHRATVISGKCSQCSLFPLGQITSSTPRLLSRAHCLGKPATARSCQQCEC